MAHPISDLDASALPLPISQAAQQSARWFASQQPTAEKAEQVRLNTLAVSAINDYLQMMEIATDLAASDSWNPIVQLCANVADLELTGLGRLECRPLPDRVEACYVPAETWEDRIGYVVVQIDSASWQAMMLGFIQSVTTELLPLDRLQPPEALFDRLHELRQLAIAQPSLLERSRVNLSLWLQNRFDAGWQTLDVLLRAEPNLAFRGIEPPSPNPSSEVKRAKLIDLGIQLGDRPVALTVELSPQPDQQTRICLQVHPTGEHIYLPPDLRLIVLDQSGNLFLEAQSRSADNYIQLQFSGTTGEQFSVRVVLGNASTTESFVI